jgi:hypothetical protein
MKPEHVDALSALLDGEPVDPGLLAESLAESGAADLLADFAALRVLARAPEDRPSAAFYERIDLGRGAARLGQRLLRCIRGQARAASWLLLGLLAGYGLHVASTGRVGVAAPTNGTAARAGSASRTAVGTAAGASQPLKSASSPPPSRTEAPPSVALRVPFGVWREGRPASRSEKPHGLN